MGKNKKTGKKNTKKNTHNTTPNINGTHAPSGTFLNDAPQNRPSKKPKNTKNASASRTGLRLTSTIWNEMSAVVVIITVATANLR